MFLILITIGSLVGGYIMDNFNGYILMVSMLLVASLAFVLIFTLTHRIKNAQRKIVECP